MATTEKPPVVQATSDAATPEPTASADGQKRPRKLDLEIDNVETILERRLSPA